MFLTKHRHQGMVVLSSREPGQDSQGLRKQLWRCLPSRQPLAVLLVVSPLIFSLVLKNASLRHGRSFNQGVWHFTKKARTDV
jgi:hypothetical protein